MPYQHNGSTRKYAPAIIRCMYFTPRKLECTIDRYPVGIFGPVDMMRVQSAGHLASSCYPTGDNSPATSGSSGMSHVTHLSHNPLDDPIVEDHRPSIL